MCHSSNSRRYVLTAAHCFCRGEYPILCKDVKVDGQLTSVPEYNVAEFTSVYLGINAMDVRHKDRDPDLKYRPESVMHVFAFLKSLLVKLVKDLKLLQDWVWLGPG